MKDEKPQMHRANTYQRRLFKSAIQPQLQGGGSKSACAFPEKCCGEILLLMNERVWNMPHNRMTGVDDYDVLKSCERLHAFRTEDVAKEGSASISRRTLGT
ncbi:hypothetical protein R1flu_023190 [Riccia fluitans]|uniref:Uncharacterized protein n=1 Tax=Riccia fluitans TaxID=41844 RepID=A0ABD1XRB8_9MARC